MYGYEERNIDVDYESKRNYPGNNECRDAFKAGADWADEHIFIDWLWQESYEEPIAKNFQIIYYSTYLRIFAIDFVYNLIISDGGEEMSWKNVVKKKRISKWAYADWLLPVKEKDCFLEQEIGEDKYTNNIESILRR